MPLTKTAEKVKKSMQKQYGKEKGAQVFHATAAKKGGEPEKAKTWEKKGGEDECPEEEKKKEEKKEMKEHVVSQDVEIIVEGGDKYLLETGDRIVIEPKTAQEPTAEQASAPEQAAQ